MTNISPGRADRRAALIIATALALLIAAIAFVPGGAAAKPRPKGTGVSVMTRNLYLGADLSPAINAADASAFIKANGQILRDVDTNDFPVRAKGLAKEILTKKPDLVGLQEVALWRDGPVDFNAALSGNYTASNVVFDYLQSLLDHLNKGKKNYRLVKVQDEFDFEGPADYDNNSATGSLGADKNGRLTMRDAILARVGAGVKTKNSSSGTFKTLYEPTVGGTVKVSVKRGYLRTDARVRGSKPFGFVNTHLEAFGDTSIREAQAKELIAKGGPATGKLPVILAGDLNSDDNTVTGGDRSAFVALKKGGFVDRSTEKPMSCCVKSGILTADQGQLSDFDHHIDHIATDTPKRIKLVKSTVTGRTPVNGFYDSDHAGVFSSLLILP